MHRRATRTWIAALLRLSRDVRCKKALQLVLANVQFVLDAHVTDDVVVAGCTESCRTYVASLGLPPLWIMKGVCMPLQVFLMLEPPPASGHLAFKPEPFISSLNMGSPMFAAVNQCMNLVQRGRGWYRSPSLDDNDLGQSGHW